MPFILLKIALETVKNTVNKTEKCSELYRNIQ